MPARSPIACSFGVTFKYFKLIGWFAVIPNIGRYDIMFGSFLRGKFLLDLCSKFYLFIFYVYGCTLYMLCS